jgi:hypothetical protein
LLALNQAAAPSGVVLRVNETGNPWAVLREDGVRCKVATQVERQHGILRVVLGLTVCWGAPVQLPRELRADCDGVPLQCLNVAQTLETLYGTATAPTSATTPGLDAAAASFAAVSEREDYRVPSNYKRLQQSVDDAQARSVAVPANPALVTVPGVAYPGPALLGDARALGAFLQQRQLYRPGEAEQVGWVIFSGPALRHGGVVHLDIDLGQGVRHLTFTLPK